jgi:hypothetical protein
MNDPKCQNSPRSFFTKNRSRADLPLPEFAPGLHPTVWQLFKQSLLFIRQEKKWWLVPLIFMLLLLGALILFSSTSVLAPFMYPFM